MRNLTVIEQKHVVGGDYFKVYYEDGTYIGKRSDARDARAMMNRDVVTYGRQDGWYHFFQYTDSGRKVTDWWETY